jgi:hypothetical protein
MRLAAGSCRRGCPSARRSPSAGCRRWRSSGGGRLRLGDLHADEVSLVDRQVLACRLSPKATRRRFRLKELRCWSRQLLKRLTQDA